MRALVERLNGRSIVIVGMMASGKTRIGRLIAEWLNLPFHDLDYAIEEAAGRRVADIFESHGEPEFRRMEEVVLKRLLADRQSVLALGGGAWTSRTIRDLCDSHVISIWLDVPVETLVARAARSDRRPLLSGPDPATTIRSLLEQRRSLYASASIHVATEDGGPQSTGVLVLEKLREYATENLPKVVED